jgi:hypothetical protein
VRPDPRRDWDHS